MVSGTRKETSVPHSMNSAKICMRWLSQGWHAAPLQFGAAPLLRSGGAMTCATIAPILPAAAEIPCPVERYRVGKHSPGIRKVVVFGPKLKNSWASM